MWRCTAGLSTERRAPRPWGTTVLGAAALAAALGATDARGDGVIAGSELRPVEQRIAIAVGAGRTTTWSSLRFDGPGGTVALVVPVRAGAALDGTSRAFFEALEDATAIRVVPPDQKPALCPGDASKPTYSVEGDVEGAPALGWDDVVVLPSSVDVQAWAAQQGLIVDPLLVGGMDAIDDATTSFAVLRFTAPAGPVVTRTLRVVSPGEFTTLPFVLSVAGTSDLRITAWQLGHERARLSGVEVTLDPEGLDYDAGKDTSNYRELLGGVLSDPSRYVVEASSHFALASSVSLFDGTASIPGTMAGYFERSVLAGDTTGDAAGCTFKAATALGQMAAFGLACPRADLGFVDPPTSCTPTPGAVDVDALACGGVTDDFAIAFSETTAFEAWVTRSTLRLAPHQAGVDAAVSFGPGPVVEPVAEAAKIDTSHCDSASSTGSGPPPSTSGGGTVEVPVYQHEGCDCSGNYVLIGYEDVADTGSDAPDALYDDGSDGCSGSPDEGLYTNAPGDDCAYDPGDTADTEGCDCSSDADAGGCDDAGEFGDDCASGAGDSCDTGADACSGFDASGCDCAVATHDHRTGKAKHARASKRRPVSLRLSPIVYGLALVLIPARRRRRPDGAATAPRLRTLFRRPPR